MSSARKLATPSAVDQGFQNLLLEIANTAAQPGDTSSLAASFCRAIRQYFGFSGVYCWKLERDHLLGLGADGYAAERFPGVCLKLTEDAAPVAAVSSQQPVCSSGDRPTLNPLQPEVPAVAGLSVPMAGGGQTVGVLTFLHTIENALHDEQVLTKASILAALLAGSVQSAPGTPQSRQERRRAEVLVRCAQVLHGKLEAPVVTSALVEHVRASLKARVVALLLRAGEGFTMPAVAAETPEVAEMVQRRYAGGESSGFAAELAAYALQAGEPLVVGVPPQGQQPLCEPAGSVLVAPLRTPGSSGAILVQSCAASACDKDERELVSAIISLGELAISNAEQHTAARAQARELQQLLDVSRELVRTSALSELLECLVVRAADFLGFRSALVAMLEEGNYWVRCLANQGRAEAIRVAVPDAVVKSILSAEEPYWTDDGSRAYGVDLPGALGLRAKQYLAIALRDFEGNPLGFLMVLERKDAAAITPEDARRAKSLAAQAATALGWARALHRSDAERRQAESLTQFAVEFNSSLHLPEFVGKFAERATSILNARGAAVALAQRSELEIVVLHEPDADHPRDVLRRLHLSLPRLLAQTPQQATSGPAERFLEKAVAASLGWARLGLARLTSSEGEVIGLLCVIDPESGAASVNNLLKALASQASVALENSRLFTRMEQANRHWIEIFDSITDLIVVHDQTNKVLRVNRSLADLIGVRPSELIGISMRALASMTGDSTNKPCPFCRDSGGGADEYVHPAVERSYLISTSRLNEGLQTIHVLKDITDRREAERRYRELFDNIQEGLFFSTPEGRFIEVNEALVRMLGYQSREELLKADIPTELYLSPEERKPFSEALEQHGTLRNYQETLRRKDGSLVHTLQNAFAVRDLQGRVLQYRGLILDITDLKNFQAELQRERDFNSKVLNNTQSLILVADTAGLVSFANRRCYEAGLYQRSDLVGKKLAELIPTPRRQAVSDALESVLHGQQVDNLELPVILGGGRIGQFSVNLSPMRDEQGNVNSIVVVMTDITDAAMLQAKLMHTEKLAAVGQLVSGVAHEVNNPLTAILGFADLLLEDPAISENGKKDLRVIIQEAQRTKQIVQNLLSFARQMPPHRVPVQLNGIVRRTLALRSYDLANHGVEIVERLDDALPEVVGDSHQLQQVFLNILNNAYDAVRESGRPGRIEIISRIHEKCAEVAFCDNGPGIIFPDRIFDPFFTTKEVGKGTGLGLSICYGIVHEHGGEISCFNNTSQEGATFVVRLPIHVGAAVLAAGAHS